MTKYVEFDQPWQYDVKSKDWVNCTSRIKVEDVIRYQTGWASTKGFIYQSEQEALDDFVHGYFAKIVED